MAINFAVKEITVQAIEISAEFPNEEVIRPLSVEELVLIGGGHATVNTI